MALRSTNEAKRMSESGTATFTDPDNYQAAIGVASVKPIVSGGVDFKARLTWLNLRHRQLLRGCENLPSIAFTSLPPARIFVSFPTSAAPLIWDGVELGLGDIVFHSRAERAHQRTTGESQWGLVSLSPDWLAFFSHILIGRKITSPPVGRVLRPPWTTSRRLLRLHSKACGLVETRGIVTLT